MPTSTPLATTDYANSYFAGRLHSCAWFDSTSEDQATALLQSTRVINQLTYSYNKTSLTQENEFPRNGSTQVPDEVMQACCENAIMLLDGFDIEQEIKGMNVSDRGYAQVRTRYKPEYIAEHLTAGFASAIAFNLLRPFFARSDQVALKRV